MMTIADIVDSATSPYAEWRTLSGIRPVIRDGRPVYVTGNAAVSLRVEYEGRSAMLKCYTRPNPRLKAIYGSAYRERELVVSDIAARQCRVDCLLMDYVEGRSLDVAICDATSSEDFLRLAESFDSLARTIFRSDRAHGDLKPENIIVREDGSMEAIDWDAAFLPCFAGERAYEIGTAAYQHPLRTMEFYDEHLDDYSIALISTLLYAAALFPSIGEHYRQHHEPPIHPYDMVRGRSPLLDEVEEEFARRGWARQYRMAAMLREPGPRLFRLRSLLEPCAESIEGATLDVDWGWWGCRSDAGWVIPPLYDSGFEPREGVALMLLDGYSHFVRLEDGATLMSFERGVQVRSLRNGSATVRYTDGRERIITVEELNNSAK